MFSTKFDIKKGKQLQLTFNILKAQSYLYCFFLWEEGEKIFYLLNAIGKI